MATYINEPLVQKMPSFISFMGGLEFLRHTQKLKMLTDAPRRWRGNRISVTVKHSYSHEPQVTVRQDDIIVHCNHVNTEIEQVTSMAGLDGEYSRPLAVCQVCEYTTDENGEEYY